VRVQLCREAKVSAWLQRLQREQVEARQYEFASLASVQAWSDVPGGVPLFKSNIVFENYASNAFEQTYADELKTVSTDDEMRVGYAGHVHQAGYSLSLTFAPQHWSM